MGVSDGVHWKQRFKELCAESIQKSACRRYSSPPLSAEDMSQDPHWMPETVDSPECCVYCSYAHIPMIKSNS